MIINPIFTNPILFQKIHGSGPIPNDLAALIGMSLSASIFVIWFGFVLLGVKELRCRLYGTGLIKRIVVSTILATLGFTGIAVGSLGFALFFGAL